MNDAKIFVSFFIWFMSFFSIISLADEIYYANVDLGGEGVSSCTYSQNCTQEV